MEIVLLTVCFPVHVNNAAYYYNSQHNKAGFCIALILAHQPY